MVFAIRVFYIYLSAAQVMVRGASRAFSIPNMRVALCGKGGVGKTAVTAMLVRHLARSGRVLAFDFDVNPGLERSVGPLDRDPRLSLEAVAAREGAQYGHELRGDLTPTAAAFEFAAIGPDGLRLLSFGRMTTAFHDLGTTHYALRQIADGFDADGWDVVVDMEAGTKDVFDRYYVRFVDVLALVTDGSAVANLVCRRLASIAREQGEPPVGLVLNRATPARRQAATDLAAELGLALIGEVPHDEGVRQADVAGEPTADHAPDTPAVAAVGHLAAALRAHATGTPAPPTTTSTEAAASPSPAAAAPTGGEPCV